MRLVSQSTKVNSKLKSLAVAFRLTIIVIIKQRNLCLDYKVEYGKYLNFDHYQIPQVQSDTVLTKIIGVNNSHSQIMLNKVKLDFVETK